MYRPRPFPVLTGEAAARFHEYMENGTIANRNIDYSQYVKAWEEIDKRCEKPI